VQPTQLGGIVRGAVVAAVLAAVTACGGGGGGGGQTVSNPVISTTSFTTNENVALSGALAATDANGAVTFAQGTGPTSGTLSGFTSAGAFVYTPKANFTGSDSFTVTASDSAGHSTTGTIGITVTVDQPPAATDTVVSASGAQLASINVLATAKDPDNDKLTVAIATAPFVGSATVNSDQSVNLTVPSGFKGVTNFTYTVTDPSGKSATAGASVFVGTSPFQAVFVGDAAGSGANEVYLTDFATQTPTQLTSATQGNLQLQGFAVSDNGATVVYRTQDKTNAASTSLSFVQTATPKSANAIALPGGGLPIQDASSKDQYVVSPDGNWIALIGGQANNNSLYVVSVADKSVTAVTPSPSGAAAVYATQPIFTSDSKNVYFLASSVTGGANKSLYVVNVGSLGTQTLVSELSVAATNDEIYSYSVAPNQATIVELANRAGRIGVFFVDPAHLQTEYPVNQPPGAGTAITSSTVGLAPWMGGSSTGKTVAYDVGNPATGADPNSVGIYVVPDVTASTTTPVLVAQDDQIIGFNPTDSAVLFTDGSKVFEVPNAGGADTQVGQGQYGWYDSTGNIVLLEKELHTGQGIAAGATLTGAVRGAPWTTPAADTTPITAYYVDASGMNYGAAAIVAEGPASGSAPTTAQLGIVNALDIDAVFNLASFQSPLALATYTSKAVVMK
jgi:hypothetical protein